MTMKDDGFWGGVCCGILMSIFLLVMVIGLTNGNRIRFVDIDNRVVEYKGHFYRMEPVEKIYVEPTENKE